MVTSFNDNDVQLPCNSCRPYRMGSISCHYLLIASGTDTQTLIHAHTHACTYIHTHECTYTYAHMHAHTHARTHTHIHTHACTYTHIHLHTIKLGQSFGIYVYVACGSMNMCSYVCMLIFVCPLHIRLSLKFTTITC